MVSPNIVDGNLLDQPVEVIVNAWNRNIIPWWLLIPQGVSGAIKRRGGYRQADALQLMLDAFAGVASAASVVVVLHSQPMRRKRKKSMEQTPTMMPMAIG